MTPKELAIIAAKALDEKKGKEISAIEITDLTTIADYFGTFLAPSRVVPRSNASPLHTGAEFFISNE